MILLLLIIIIGGSWSEESTFEAGVFRIFGKGSDRIPELVAMGERAFEEAVFALNYRGSGFHSSHAIRVLKAWIQQEDSFLHADSTKRAIAREALIRAAAAYDPHLRGTAVDALKYFTDPKIRHILEYINKNDPEIRSWTERALEYYKVYSQPLSTLERDLPEEFRIDPESLLAGFHSSAKRVGEYLNEFADFTEMLAQYSDSEKIRNFGNFTFPVSNDTLTIKVPVDRLEKYEVLGWTIQNIGFHNLALGVEGYYLATKKEILKLQIENMILRNADADTIRQMQSHYRKAKRELDYFIATNSWSD